jgi:hypothetical protein
MAQTAQIRSVPFAYFAPFVADSKKPHFMENAV